MPSPRARRIVEPRPRADADSIVREAEARGPGPRRTRCIRQANNEITEIIVAATAKVAGVPVGGDSDL